MAERERRDRPPVVPVPARSRMPRSRRTGLAVDRGAFTVDLWYTLVYQRAEERRRYEQARRDAWAVELDRAGLGPSSADRWARVVEARGRPPLQEPIPRRLAWLRAATGRPLRARNVYRELDRAASEARVHPVPGALPFLREATARGYRVGLLSNVTFETPEATRRILRRTGLRPYLAVLALSNETALAKPDPAAWRACWRRLGVRSGPVVHIGDSPEDVTGIPVPLGAPWLFLGAARWMRPADRRAQRAVRSGVPRFSSWPQIRKALLAGPRAAGAGEGGRP